MDKDPHYKANKATNEMLGSPDMKYHNSWPAYK